MEYIYSDLNPYNCDKCWDGIIYKKVKYISKDSGAEYIVEEFCNCDKRIKLLRQGYRPKVFKNVSI